MGEEIQGANFSPSGKKPLAITKGGRRGGLVSSPFLLLLAATKGEREEDLSLLNRLITFGEETDGDKSERGARLFLSPKVQALPKV